MKKALLIILAAIFAIPAFQSCKKGENDPGLSLRSRKARLCGEWTLKEGFTQNTDHDGTITTYTYNGTNVVITETGFPDDGYIIAKKLAVNKDGTYKLENIYEDNETIAEGAWYFGRANKDLELKDKETVIFVRNKYTYPDGSTNISTGTEILDNFSTWQIDRLSNKELIVLIIGSSTENGETSSYTGTMTYEKK